MVVPPLCVYQFFKNVFMIKLSNHSIKLLIVVSIFGFMSAFAVYVQNASATISGVTVSGFATVGSNTKIINNSNRNAIRIQGTKANGDGVWVRFQTGGGTSGWGYTATARYQIIVCPGDTATSFDETISGSGATYAGFNNVDITVEARVYTVQSTYNGGRCGIDVGLLGSQTASGTGNPFISAITLDTINPTPTFGNLTGAALSGGSAVVSIPNIDVDGTNDTTTAVLTCGTDGTAAGSITDSSTNATCTYTSAGSKTVTITSTDNAGNTGTESKTVTITPPRPTVTITRAGTTTLSTATGRNTDTITFTLSGTPDTGTLFLLNDTSVSPTNAGRLSNLGGTSAALTATFTPGTSYNGNATISVRENAFEVGDVGNAVPTGLVIPVDTLRPIPTFSDPTDVTLTGSSVAVPISGIDLDSNDDTATATMTCGSGGTATGSITDGSTNAVCTYTTTGSKTITITSTDDAGNVGTGTQTVSVNDANNSPTIAFTGRRGNAALTPIPSRTSPTNQDYAIRVTVTDTDTANVVNASYKYINYQQTCNETNYNRDTDTAITFTVSGSQTSNFTDVAVTSSLNNDNIICVKADDQVGGVTYGASGRIDIDKSAPTITTVTAIGTTNDNTPDYIFDSTEPTSRGTPTLAVGGGCSSTTTTAAFGNNTITLAQLTDNTYSACTVTITDPAGNATTHTIPSFTIDTVAPTTTITRAGTATLTDAASTTTITVTFNEAVTGFVVGDITVANGTLSNFAGSGTTYTATLTAADNFSGNITVDVAASVAQDAATNNNAAATQLSIAADRTNPTVSSGTNAITHTVRLFGQPDGNLYTTGINPNAFIRAGSTVEVTLVTSEDVKDFSDDDNANTSNIVVSIGSSDLAISRTTFNTTDKDGQKVSFTVNAGETGAINVKYILRDTNGNISGAQATHDPTLEADTTAPSIANITPTIALLHDSCVDINNDGTCEYGANNDFVTNSITSASNTGTEANRLQVNTTSLTNTSNEYAFLDIFVAQGNRTADLTAAEFGRKSTRGNLVGIAGATTSNDFRIRTTLDLATAAATAAPTDGQYTIIYLFYDRAGNITEHRQALTVDRTAPTAPTIDLDSSSDSGDDNTDNLTNISNNLSFTLGNPATEAVYLTINEAGGVARDSTSGLGATVTAASGSPVTPTTQAILVDLSGAAINPTSATTVTAESYDTSGNRATATLTNGLRHDNAVAEATFALKANSSTEINDTGFSATDRITNNTTPTFVISNIESGADPTAGTGDADLTIYSWTDSASGDGVYETGNTLTSPMTNGTLQAAEVTTLFTTNNAAATTQEYTFATLTEGIHRILVEQQDHAGNTSRTPVTTLVYSAADGSKGNNVVIVDTTAPQAPGAPNLNPANDSFGAYSSVSRDGTNSDNITNVSTLNFSSNAALRAVGGAADLTQAALTRETHHISFFTYGTLPAGTVTQASPTAFTGNPAATAARNISSSNAYDASTTSWNRKDSHNYSLPAYNRDDLTGGFSNNDVHVVARQTDAAGNISAASTALDLTLDNQPPTPITRDLVLHPGFDTGSDQTDKNTSSTTTLISTTGRSTEADTDYYVLKRIRLNNAQAAVETAFTYPSNVNANQQVSTNYISEGCNSGEAIADCQTRITGLTAQASRIDTYTNGVSVYLSSQTIPAFNTWYGYKIFSVDTAGNEIGGADQNNIRILVPPPTPEKLNLADASDSSRNGYTAGATDDITNNTTITLTGRFGNGLTSTGNTATSERDNNAAVGARNVVITIDAPGSLETKTRTLTIVRPSTTSSPVQVPADAGDSDASTNTPYTFSTEINLTDAAFYGTNLIDGEYSITARLVNTAGEEGSNSTPLEINLDRQNPTPGESEARLVTERGHRVDGTNIADRVKFTFTSRNNDDSANLNAGFNLYTEETGGTAITGQSATTSGYDLTINSGATGYNEDFTYFIEYVDAAGNTTTRAALANNIKAPKITSYTVDGTNRVLIAETFGGNTQQSFTTGDAHTDNTCAEATLSTAYTAGSRIDAPNTAGNERCAKFVDNRGNTAYLRIGLRASPLVANFRVGNVANGVETYTDDTGISNSDRITNDNTPRITATTIPGSTGTIQYKPSTISDWETSGALTDGVTSVAINTLFEGTTSRFNLPALTQLADGTYNFRAVVANTGVGVSSTEVALDNVVIDTTPIDTTNAYAAFNDQAGNDSGSRTDAYTNILTSIDTFIFIGTGDVENAQRSATDSLAGIAKIKYTIGSLVSGFEDPGTITYTENAGGARTIRLYKTPQIDLTPIENTRNTYSIEIKDTAGNTSTIAANTSRSNTITVDTQASGITIIRVGTAEFLGIAVDNLSSTAQINHRAKNTLAVSDCNATGYGVANNNPGGGSWAPALGTPLPAIDGTTNGVCFRYLDLANNVTFRHTLDPAVASTIIQGVGIQRYHRTGTETDASTAIATTTDGTNQRVRLNTGAFTIVGQTANSSATEIRIRRAGATDWTDANVVQTLTPTSNATGVVTQAITGLSAGVYEIGTRVNVGGTLQPAINTLAALSTFEVDTTAPTITQQPTFTTNNASGNTAKSGDTVTVVFRASEILNSATAVTIAGQTATCTLATAITGDISCVVTLTNAATEGNASTSLIVRDLALNETRLTAQASPTLTIDATAPSVAFTSTKSRLVNPANGVDYNLTVTLTDSTGIANGTYNFTVDNAPASNNSCSVTVTGTPTRAANTCAIKLNTGLATATNIQVTSPAIADTAGNSHTNPAQTVHTVDLEAPAVTAVSAVNTSNRRQPSFSITVSHNQNTANQATPEKVTVSLQGSCSVFTVSTSTFTQQTPDANPKTYQVATTTRRSGEYTGCTVTLTDEAGNASTPTAIPTFTITSSGGGGGGGASIAFTGSPSTTTQETIINQTTQAPTQSTPARIPTPTRNLDIGSTGNDVLNLQRLLNSRGYTIRTQGAGSPGNETSYFGPATKQALIKFQSDNGLPATGYFGPLTKAKIQATQQTQQQVALQQINLNPTVEQKEGETKTSFLQRRVQALKKVVQMLMDILGLGKTTDPQQEQRTAIVQQAPGSFIAPTNSPSFGAPQSQAVQSPTQQPTPTTAPTTSTKPQQEQRTAIIQQAPGGLLLTYKLLPCIQHSPKIIPTKNKQKLHLKSVVFCLAYIIH